MTANDEHTVTLSLHVQRLSGDTKEMFSDTVLDVGIGVRIEIPLFLSLRRKGLT